MDGVVKSDIDAVVGSPQLDRISKAIRHYQRLGYTYVDLPWLVGHQAQETRGKPDQPFVIEGYVVASGEQSFLDLVDLGNKPRISKKYIGWTPCFRKEPKYDALHHSYFMKVELFGMAYDEAGAFWLAEGMREDAKNLFDIYLPDRTYEEASKAEEVDIMFRDIELGSYGHRKYKNFWYAYGTGLAEPRFTRALEICNDEF